jgi:hypothetical protein
MLQTVTDTQTDLANSCLVLHDISWENYEQLLEIFAESQKQVWHLARFPFENSHSLCS